MKKRALAVFLWFYSCWYAGAMLADVLSISPVLGPVLGSAAAVLVVWDPRGIMNARQSAEVRSNNALPNGI
jgi:hypothetical protein